MMLSQCKNYSTARLAEVAAAILPGASDDFIRSAVWLVDEAARFVTATVRRCQTAELNKNDSDAYRVHRSLIDTWSQGIDNPLDERFAFAAIAAPVRATGSISREAAPSSFQAVQAWRVASAHQVQPPLSCFVADQGAGDTVLSMEPRRRHRWSSVLTHRWSGVRLQSATIRSAPIDSDISARLQTVIFPGGRRRFL